VATLLFLLSACNTSRNSVDQGDFIPDPEGPSKVSKAQEVIYSLYLPTDITTIFEETGTGFNPNLTLPLDRVPLYENEEEMALVMGALGVDLSYCTLFERIQESASCYKHIELLGSNLDLPEEYFEQPSNDLEQYINQPDSLTVLIDQVYSDVDSYYKENGQESLASLSLLGGWLEAMYIGVRLFQEKSILELGDRILQQKYALNSLAGLLANYQESLMIRRYMHPLNKLKSAYEQVEIRYVQDGFEIDQEQRMLHAAVSEIVFEPETLDQICEIILQVRDELVD